MIKNSKIHPTFFIVLLCLSVWNNKADLTYKCKFMNFFRKNILLYRQNFYFFFNCFYPTALLTSHLKGFAIQLFTKGQVLFKGFSRYWRLGTFYLCAYHFFSPPQRKIGEMTVLVSAFFLPNLHSTHLFSIFAMTKGIPRYSFLYSKKFHHSVMKLPSGRTFEWDR